MIILNSRKMAWRKPGWIQVAGLLVLLMLAPVAGMAQTGGAVETSAAAAPPAVETGDEGEVESPAADSDESAESAAESAEFAVAATPAHELREHRVGSPKLRTRKLLAVYLPPGYDPSGETTYPVLYYLHGLGNTALSFFREGIADLTDELILSGAVEPLIIACPSGAASFYVDRIDGTAPYESHFLTEVMPFVEDHYPVRRDRAGRAIGGVSMGGYGALKIAMRHPELFIATSAHTPFLMNEIPDLNTDGRFSRMFMNAMKTLYGDPIDPGMWNENNPFWLIAQNDYEDLAIYFNAADRDRFMLYQPGLDLHAAMEAEGVAHTFVLIEDVHGWRSLTRTWDEILGFHDRHFAAPPDGGALSAGGMSGAEGASPAAERPSPVPVAAGGP